MSLVDSIFFGALQGVTEFLPISSSGHLILLTNFFQVDLPTIVYEVVVHLGTLISILFIFRSDIISIINKAKTKRDFKEIILIASATVPIALTGLIFKSNIETAFRSVNIVGVCMVITGIILGSTLFTSSIRKKNISLVINTTEGKDSIADSFSLRRTSLINKVPYFTTIAAANACLESIEALKKYPIKVRALQDS